MPTLSKKRTNSFAYYQVMHKNTETKGTKTTISDQNNKCRINGMIDRVASGRINPDMSAASQGRPSNCKGLNHQFLAARKENCLNTCYNHRKQRLQEITAQNKKLYRRINGQTSAYSREGMRKSYESSASISRMLSDSRSTFRSSHSRKSVARDKQKYFTSKQHKNTYKIDAKAVHNLQKQQVKKFNDIFSVQNTENTKPAHHHHITKRRVNESVGVTSNKMTITEKSRNQSNSMKTVDSKLPHFRSKNSQPHRQPLSIKNNGDFLHKIAEEMFRVPKNHK